MFSFHYWFSEVEFTPSGYRKDIWGHEHFSFCCNHRVWHKMSTFKGQSAWWVANRHLRLLHIARGCVCEGLPIDLSIRMIGSWPCMFWQHHDYITRPILYKIYQIILRVMRCSNCLTMLHISKQYFVSELKTPHSFIEIRLYFFTLKTLTANHWIFIIITDQSFTASGFFLTLLQRHILAGSMCQTRIVLGTWRSSDFSLILSLWIFDRTLLLGHVEGSNSAQGCVCGVKAQILIKLHWWHLYFIETCRKSYHSAKYLTMTVLHNYLVHNSSCGLKSVQSGHFRNFLRTRVPCHENFCFVKFVQTDVWWIVTSLNFFSCNIWHYTIYPHGSQSCTKVISLSLTAFSPAMTTSRVTWHQITPLKRKCYSCLEWKLTT